MDLESDPRGMFTTAQAAAYLDVQEVTVRAAIQRGRIKAERHWGRWFLKPESLAEYKRTRNKNGGRK
jgi:excisionase family DNA binding protein